MQEIPDAREGQPAPAPARSAPRAPLRLDPLVEAVAAARRYVQAALASLGRTDLEDCAVLGVSELVTNSMIHARTRLTVAVEPTGDTVRITVRDFSPVLPRQRHYGVEATTGRGLRLVESLSASWGVKHTRDAEGNGKAVWFEPLPDMTASGFSQTDWLAELEQT